MSRKATKAAGAGSIAVGGSADGAKIATHVTTTEAPKSTPAKEEVPIGSTITSGAGAIAIGGGADNATLSTFVEQFFAVPSAPAIDFPTLEEPVDLILRITRTGSEELRFDALARDGRRAGPFTRRIAKAENFAQKLSELSSRSGTRDGRGVEILRAVGMDISECIPKELFDRTNALLGGLLGRSGPPPSVLILTDEAYIPWELAFVGSSDAGRSAGAFLGQVARVGRWPISEQHPAPHATLDVGVFNVFAAKSYAATGSQKNLPYSIAEQDFLAANFNAISHDATGPEIDAWLRSSRPRIETFHIAVHGYNDPNANEQNLILGDGYALTPEELLGISAGGDPRPYSLVFINACQAATGGQTLGQVAGFTGTLARRGAGAIIAPLWEVDDHEACEFAKSFYIETLREEKGAGAALRGLRDLAGSNSVTGLAYVFFGHPLLKLKWGSPRGDNAK